MSGRAVLCTDGSELSIAALRAGLRLLSGQETRCTIVTVVDLPDPSLVSGMSGMAGGIMSSDEFESIQREQWNDAQRTIQEAVDALQLVDVDSQILTGDAGQAICAFAHTTSASLIVVGSRGRSGVMRAMLGSVSDHIVRHAPCPVLISGTEAAESSL